MRERGLVAVVALAALTIQLGCGSNPPPAPSPRPPSGTSARASATPSNATSTTEADEPTLDEAPKLGFLERRADGTCWYGTNPAGPLQRVVTCPPTTGSASSKAAPTEDAPTGGYLEKIVGPAGPSCWWSLRAPDECPVGAVCRPDPPVDRVRCP